MKPLIIGAGPVGSNTARLIKKLDPIIIESGKRIGLPVKCTGLMSTRLRELTKFPKELILNSITGARLFSDNKEVVINPKRVMAHVIDRAGFDKWLHNLSGAETHLNERFINYDKGLVKTSKNSYETNLVIDCSGPRIDTEHLMGVQAVVNLKRRPDFVELHFNQCPDFFGWVVPAGSKCRVGLASNKANKPMQRLKRFLKELDAGKVVEWNAGLIPMKVNDFISDGYIRCGDAAGHVKSVSGGGVVTGLLSSEVMCEAVLKAYEEGDFSRSFFRKHYYKPWKHSVGRELRLHSWVRNYLNKVDYDDLLTFIEKNIDLIQHYGDMDFLSKFIFKLLRPRNLPFLFKSIPKLIT